LKHIGKHSSLNGKVQPLTDDKFKDRLVYEKHKNPNANLSSSLITYSTFTLKSCYNGENFYWAFNEKNNRTDFINFKFKPPFLLRQLVISFFITNYIVIFKLILIKNISRYYIKSGNLEHPGDLIPENSTIEIKNSEKSYLKIGTFGSNGIANGTVLPDYGEIEEFQINISKHIDNWIVILEIVFL